MRFWDMIPPSCWDEWAGHGDTLKVQLCDPYPFHCSGTSAADFFHQFTLSLLPSLPSYLPKMCQFQNKGINRGSLAGELQSPAISGCSLWLWSLSCSISYLHSCEYLLFHHCYTQAVISSFYGCLQLNSLLILT